MQFPEAFDPPLCVTWVLDTGKNPVLGQHSLDDFSTDPRHNVVSVANDSLTDWMESLADPGLDLFDGQIFSEVELNLPEPFNPDLPISSEDFDGELFLEKFVQENNINLETLQMCLDSEDNSDLDHMCETAPTDDPQTYCPSPEDQIVPCPRKTAPDMFEVAPGISKKRRGRPRKEVPKDVILDVLKPKKRGACGVRPQRTAAERHQRKQEQNRVASMRYRLKEKMKDQALEEQYKDAKEKNSALTTEVHSWRLELKSLQEVLADILKRK